MAVKLTMGDIAELAGVKRPAVSNWRRRHADFPQPVKDDGRRSLFDSDQVGEWLESRELPLGQITLDGPETYGERFRERLRLRAISELRGVLPGDEVVARGVALAAVTTVLGETFGVNPYRQINQRRPDLAPLFKPLLDGLNAGTDRLSRIVMEMLQGASPLDVVDRLIEQADRVDSTIRATTTPGQVGELVAAIAIRRPWGSVYDPAAGIGTLLRRVLKDRPIETLDVFAADIDDSALRLLKLSFLAGCYELTTYHQDSFRPHCDVRVDLVVMDPPFVPSDPGKRKRSKKPDPFKWVQLAHRHLKPGGRGLVVLPAWALKQAGLHDPTARLRAELARSGLIHSVVRLPPRSHSFRVGAELALVVVDQAPDPERWVLLVEAGALERAHGGRWIDEVVSILHGRPAEPREGFDRVRAADCDDRRSLLPEPGTAKPPLEDAAANDLLDAQRRLAQLFPDDPELLTVPVVADRTGRRCRELGAYRRSKQLVFLPGHRIDPIDLGQGDVPLVGAEELRDGRVVGSRTVDDLSLAVDLGDYEAVRRTMPGDVVVLSTGRVHACVDTKGGKVVEAPAQVIRIAQDKTQEGRTPWMTPRVLAALLVAAGVPERASGPLVRRVNLTKLELPELTPEEVATLDDVLRQVEEREAGLQRRLSALRGFGAALMAGIAGRSLRVMGELADDR
ncbi:N-6 DNA methylase [Streptosporangium sp. NPDC000396]|uniref:N-6 DNA methylase n=1 Tax=Streptosporangium sp. NPDC000396 TaxID=3366185 RepID=UPI0036BFCADB